MDSIKTRLQETVAECVKCLEVWEGDTKNAETRESLSAAVHELRKVASRLEIDMAISERGEKSKKPIAIPAHRDRSPRAADQVGGDDGSGSNRKPRSGGKSSGGRRGPRKAKTSDGNS